jgi:hypothetical protein
VFDGVEYSIGQAVRVHFVWPRLVDVPDEWIAGGTIPDGADLRFVAGSTDAAEVTLVE